MLEFHLSLMFLFYFLNLFTFFFNLSFIIGLSFWIYLFFFLNLFLLICVTAATFSPLHTSVLCILSNSLLLPILSIECHHYSFSYMLVWFFFPKKFFTIPYTFIISSDFSCSLTSVQILFKNASLLFLYFCWLHLVFCIL